MSGKGETVRYTRRRAPEDPEERGRSFVTGMSYEELKKHIAGVIDTAAGEKAKITVISLVEVDQPKK